ncbi:MULTISPECIES: TetR/AcrR family transcriptional regulator [Actinomadura]|uniref:TetR/AcrR family transcriptional regulator n=1 Tax=Actinomadura yumaensis TaxID=111807 RepID=A0ABW2CMC4_9ACTN|nr:TetR/AcrR family transcriptional regulator [Actinomadura sp. J1-007]MWK32801.1 TetR family transcriptional regulator [Actinomadura sp. J1-007]
MSARERILDAAAEVMREHGAVGATTKEIARAAGYSEALLYKHFRDKEELLLCVLKERMPSFAGAGAPGEGTVEGNLVAFVQGGLRFYRRAFPMMASMASAPRLLAATRDALSRYGAGPRAPVANLAAYLRAEQGLGRVDAGADADAAAALLLGACFQQGFLRYFDEGLNGEEIPRQEAERLVRALLPVLLPGGPALAAPVGERQD